MPLYEHLPVKVTVIVEVDGHTLRFEETGKALGGRFHGADPGKIRYKTTETLEHVLRETVAGCVEKARRRLASFLQRAYPIYAEDVEPPEEPPGGGDAIAETAERLSEVMRRRSDGQQVSDR